MLLHLARTQRLSFIRAPCHHDALSFYPLTCHRYNIHYNRTRTSSPQTLVYMNFQLLMCTAHMSPCAWWALTPPSHPYKPCGLRLFSSTLIHPCGRLPIKKQNALCCPDFPPASPRLYDWNARDKPADWFYWCAKVQIFQCIQLLNA